jgi:hypothetical protein
MCVNVTSTKTLVQNDPFGLDAILSGVCDAATAATAASTEGNSCKLQQTIYTHYAALY